ncbi:hypothetical protein M231_01442 [Tremella mesenterica]|uniref:Uncharacterized protein n=1 Tax=Tremella mesenterica TaxID=5217 RepID=A0A4Q1BTM2_TREME|nr:hypothetical protein M231_01442 [Tremella mesenterica]
MADQNSVTSWRTMQESIFARLRETALSYLRLRDLNELHHIPPFMQESGGPWPIADAELWTLCSEVLDGAKDPDMLAEIWKDDSKASFISEVNAIAEGYDYEHAKQDVQNNGGKSSKHNCLVERVEDSSSSKAGYLASYDDKEKNIRYRIHYGDDKGMKISVQNSNGLLEYYSKKEGTPYSFLWVCVPRQNTKTYFSSGPEVPKTGSPTRKTSIIMATETVEVSDNFTIPSRKISRTASEGIPLGGNTRLLGGGERLKQTFILVPPGTELEGNDYEHVIVLQPDDATVEPSNSLVSGSTD